MTERAATAAAGGQPESTATLDDVIERIPEPLRYTIDAETVLEMITDSLQADSWDDAGGAGYIDFLEETLDYVIFQTPEVHMQVESLLDRLRAFPNQILDQGIEPAREPLVTSSNSKQLNFDGLIGVLTSVILPEGWDEAGGNSTVNEDPYRTALTISAPQPVHADIWTLFTGLRRSRYAARHGDRPWEDWQPEDRLSFLRPWTDFGQSPAADRMDLLPPAAEELEAIAPRTSRDGTWTWKRTTADGAAEIIQWKQSGPRQAAALDGLQFLLEGDAAAIYAPQFACAEIGPFAPSVLRELDSRLPWLPHRGNADLARQFRVEGLPPQANDDHVARLRIHLIGDADGAWLDVTCSREHGLPVAWESWVAGERTGALTFEDLQDADGVPVWKHITQQDAEGRVLATWELLESAPAEEIPAPAAGWHGVVMLDRQVADPKLLTGVSLAITRLEDSDWETALRLLREELQKQPGQPLLLFLTGWSELQLGRPELGRGELRQTALDRLAEVAAGPAEGLSRKIMAPAFAPLTTPERIALYRFFPPEKRLPEDLDRIADSAQDAALFGDALAAAEEALAKQPTFARAQRQIELLARIGREQDAQQAAEGLLAQHDFMPHLSDWTSLANLLASYGHKELASEALGRALRTPDATPVQKSELLLRLAGIAPSDGQWDLVLQSIEILSPDDPDHQVAWQRAAGRLLMTLNNSELAPTAGELAEKVSDPNLRVSLLLKQAQLLGPTLASNEVFWSLHETLGLPQEALARAARQFNALDEHPRTVAVLEAALRAGQDLDGDAWWNLRDAYRVLDMVQSYRRAMTTDPTPYAPRPRAARRPITGGGFF